ncbi:glycosyltransferase family 2 protein [Fulvivirga sedimenti]|uniref:Glycosyltransferase n=1 Tax=Fulvivirga sedimenti TaxID=2879465 RepID=A0A9X1HUX3_9BACT|nr:glycosyltransferase [Fulvivirga sedimenti]MCA6078360.1 glycosyltransferase [Fulvivirga sedimenti]
MKTSVIITVYNLENFLEEAIDSVFAQTVQPDEIIVVNDGSKDDSDEKIRNYLDRIIYIHKKTNEGVLPAILSAIDKSSGDILLFLDGDDIWGKTKIEKVMAIYHRHEDVMMVTHNYKWIDRDSNPLATIDETHKNLARIGTSNDSGYIQKSSILKESILSYKGVWLGSAFSIRRNVLNLTKFKSFLLETGSELIGKSHQDQPLVAFIIATNPQQHIYFLDEVLFYYRVYGENSSGNTQSLVSAFKTLERSYATVFYTFQMLERLMPERKKEWHIQRGSLAFLEYLKELYGGRRISALRKLYDARASMSFRKILKESTRFLMIATFGNKAYFTLKRFLLS